MAAAQRGVADRYYKFIRDFNASHEYLAIYFLTEIYKDLLDD